MSPFIFLFLPALTYGAPLIVLMTDDRTPQVVYRALLLYPDCTKYQLMHYDDPTCYHALAVWLTQQFQDDANARMLVIYKTAVQNYLASYERRQQRVNVVRHLDENPAFLDALAELVRSAQYPS